MARQQELRPPAVQAMESRTRPYHLLIFFNASNIRRSVRYRAAVSACYPINLLLIFDQRSCQRGLSAETVMSGWSCAGGFG